MRLIPNELEKRLSLVSEITGTPQGDNITDMQMSVALSTVESLLAITLQRGYSLLTDRGELDLHGICDETNSVYMVYSKCDYNQHGKLKKKIRKDIKAIEYKWQCDVFAINLSNV